MTTKDELLKAARNKVNDYKQTVDAILAFAAFVVHDGKSQRPNSEFGFGRRMTTSNNTKKVSVDITPDLTAQKSAEYGIVAEAKKSLDQNRSNWIDHLEQLRKYDDDLEGWWTDNEKIERSNVIMLIHQTRGRPFVRLLENHLEKFPDSVGPNTSVVEFNESPESEPFIFFRLEYGDLSDPELKAILDDGKDVPLDTVKMTYSNIEYYDAKPPMPLLLERLWVGVFASKLEEGEYDEVKKITKIRVTVSDVTDELQKAFGSQALRQDSRSGEFPKNKWIREAFDQLVDYKLGSHGAEEGEYIIYFKRFREDILTRFIRYEIEKGDKKKVKSSPKQLNFFSDSKGS